MELGQAEPLRIFDHHHRGIWHIDSHLNDSGGYQYMNFPRRKALHKGIFLLALHLAVEIFHYNGRRQRFLQGLGVIQHILSLNHLALLHHGTDNVSLMALRHLALNECICLWTIARIHHTVFYGLASRRQFIYDGYIQISVQDDGQCTRNGRGAHYQHMGFLSLAAEKLPLSHTKTVLLVGDNQGKVVVHHLFLNQGMCADYNVRLVAGNLCICQTLFLGRHGAGDQYGNLFNSLLFKKAGYGLKVLSGQHLRGYHKRALVSIICSLQQGQNSNDGLAGSHVTLNQAVHHQAASHIVIYFPQSPFLRPCKGVWQTGLKGGHLFCLLYHKGRMPVLPVLLQTPDTNQEHEELVKYQTFPGKEQLCLVSRKMDMFHGVIDFRQLIPAP